MQSAAIANAVTLNCSTYLKRFRCTTNSGGARRTCNVFCASWSFFSELFFFFQNFVRHTSGSRSRNLKSIAGIAKEFVVATEPFDGAELFEAMSYRAVLRHIDAQVQETFVFRSNLTETF